MVSVDAEAGEAAPRPPPTPAAASPAAGGPGEAVVLKAHYGSAAGPLSAHHQVVRRNSPLVGLVKGTPKLSVASKAGQAGEDAAGAVGAEGEPRRAPRASVGSPGSRGPSVFDHVERNVQPRWKTRVAGVMDGIPYTLASMLVTLLVRRRPAHSAFPCQLRAAAAACRQLAGGPHNVLQGMRSTKWRSCLWYC